MTKFIDIDEVAALIPSGSTCVTDGLTLMGVADEVLMEIEESFLKTGSPNNLTWVQAAGQSNREIGMARMAHKGLVKKVIGSHWGLTPAMGKLLGDDEAECICLPQGQLSTLYRTIAAGRPGQLSTVGLGTFVDPRVDGARFNDSAKANVDQEEYVSFVEIDGDEYLLYRPIAMDVAIIRGSVADKLGNLSQREEVSGLDALAIAQAVHNNGGIVIAQVKEVVEPGEIRAREVTVPAALVDYVVVTTDPELHHRQTHSFPKYNDDLISGYVTPENVGQAFEAQDMDETRVSIGMRGVTLVKDGDIINVGTGIPADTVGRALARSGKLDSVHLTVESGTYNGIPLGVVDFGAAIHPQAIIGHPQQMDFYNGGGVNITFMGAGQIDPSGDINVSLLGGNAVGVGGFMDITDGAQTVCFLVSATGRHQKFVEKVDQVSFSSARALARGKKVYLASEYYLLEYTEDGWTVLEVDDSEPAQEALKQIDFALSK